jgi:hypothetical protein
VLSAVIKSQRYWNFGAVYLTCQLTVQLPIKDSAQPIALGFGFSYLTFDIDFYFRRCGIKFLFQCSDLLLDAVKFPCDGANRHLVFLRNASFNKGALEGLYLMKSAFSNEMAAFFILKTNARKSRRDDAHTEYLARAPV